MTEAHTDLVSSLLLSALAAGGGFRHVADEGYCSLVCAGQGAVPLLPSLLWL